MTKSDYRPNTSSKNGPSRRSVLAGGGALLATSSILQTPAIAQGTRPVTILTWETYHDDDWLAAFTEETGIEVNPIRAGSVDEMYATTRSGAIAPDVVFVDTSSTGRYLSADLLVPFEQERVANADVIDGSLDWRTFNTINGELWGIPYAWGSLPLMYNADVISSDPTSWMALWSDEYSGKVSTFDDAFLNIPMVALATGAEDPFNTTAEEDEAIKAALRDLRPRMRTIARGFDDMATLFQGGDAVIAFCQNIAIPMGLQDNGLNAAFTYPQEGTLAWVDNAVVTKSGQGRDEVYSFINACLDPSWQARFTEKSGNNSVIPPQLALENGLSQNVYDSGEMSSMTDPTFWEKMVILQEQKDLDARLQIWNEFKAGVL